MRWFIITAVLLSGSAALASDPATWYESHPNQVKTFRQALAEEHAFLRWHYDRASGKLVHGSSEHPYWRGHHADAKTCAALAAVRVSCDYNTRITLTDFLTVNGKGLFPAEGGTNPWYTAEDRAEEVANHKKYGWALSINNAFVGQPIQNAMLAKAVRRNARLFHNGDLSAEDVRTKWK